MVQMAQERARGAAAHASLSGSEPIHTEGVPPSPRNSMSSRTSRCGLRASLRVSIDAPGVIPGTEAYDAGDKSRVCRNGQDAASAAERTLATTTESTSLNRAASFLQVGAS